MRKPEQQAKTETVISKTDTVGDEETSLTFPDENGTNEAEPEWPLVVMRYPTFRPEQQKDEETSRGSSRTPAVSALFLGGLIASALLAYDQTAQAQSAAQTLARKPGFKVEEFSGVLKSREPGRLAFNRVKREDVLPLGAEVILLPRRKVLLPFLSPKALENDQSEKSEQSPETFVRLVHPTYGEFLIPRAGRFRIDPEAIAGMTEGFRMTERGDIPSRTEYEMPKSKTPIERLFAFFIPERDLPDYLPGAPFKIEQKRYPIVVEHPEQTHLERTNTLPVVINLKWKEIADHKRPYRVFLWSEDGYSRKPIKLSSFGRAAIQISAHERFYWQVEDSSGTYASAPRTIVVREFGEDKNKENALASSHQAADNAFDELLSIPVEFPKKGTLVYACPEGGDRTLPIRFHHRHLQIQEYTISFKPRGKNKPIKIRAPEKPSILLATLPIVTEGNLAFRISGNSSNNTLQDDSNEESPPSIREGLSDTIKIHVSRACRIQTRPNFIGKLLALQAGKQLPSVGGVFVMDGAL